ncbi:hypothetical protein B0T24DRAFT_368584 [Lasiosphaeria ovina]|uniref:Uncharacterized protein n=1 Tax=Lasiosphaeria ovina TaxID=92902 RepID=A0AAE0JYP4_9PEZI|nr:hypothetical protein B0T24DRAFT_368584 [Lasiosphaeria ovina]
MDGGCLLQSGNGLGNARAKSWLKGEMDAIAKQSGQLIKEWGGGGKVWKASPQKVSRSTAAACFQLSQLALLVAPWRKERRNPGNDGSHRSRGEWGKGRLGGGCKLRLDACAGSAHSTAARFAPSSTGWPPFFSGAPRCVSPIIPQGVLGGVKELSVPLWWNRRSVTPLSNSPPCVWSIHGVSMDVECQIWLSERDRNSSALAMRSQ